MKIKKDYKNRHRTPVNIANSTEADNAKMAGKTGTGAQQSNREQMIAHEKAVFDRSKRNIVPNAKLNKK
jgi:hypothetical protein